MDTNTFYSTQIFMKSVLPLFAVLAEELPAGAKLLRKTAVIQFRALAPNENPDSYATHFKLADGRIETILGPAEHADVELLFPTTEHFVAFFKGSSKKLPRIKGFSKAALLIPTFQILLKMAALLGRKDCPPDEDEQLLLIRLLFYLLPSGISTLNKLGHPEVTKWSATSPDRVYAWTLDDHPEIASYLRVKAGKSKACRGRYERSQPFYTMRFADSVSALAVLQQSGDMLALTAEQKLIMEGAPEFGAKIGDLMMLVGSYAQA